MYWNNAYYEVCFEFKFSKFFNNTHFIQRMTMDPYYFYGSGPVLFCMDPYYRGKAWIRTIGNAWILIRTRGKAWILIRTRGKAWIRTIDIR